MPNGFFKQALTTRPHTISKLSLAGEFMNVIRVLTGNHIINVGVASWFSAQILKTIFTLIATKKLDLERLVGSGGMPSSHSALVISVAIGMATKMGFDSPEFGLSLAFAAVVMYDAMGVRRAAGEQAKVLNKMIFEFSFFAPFKKGEEDSGEDKSWEEDGEGQDSDSPALADKGLKEVLGHTPLEVLGGCLLGILVAMFMPVR